MITARVFVALCIAYGVALSITFGVAHNSTAQLVVALAGGGIIAIAAQFLRRRRTGG